MEQIRTLQGGMNLDDSVELLSPDDWSDAFNIVAGRAYERKNGEKENVRGTTAISPPGTVDIIGSTLIGNIRSAQDDVSYLFFYNPDPAKNSIVKFSQGTLSRVLTWSGLNFSPDHRINGGGVADGNIYFSDDYNQPRCVSETRYAGGSTPASEEEILHIKRGPRFAPLVVPFASTTESPIDDVQFAYQYEYEDGQLSVISPWSFMFITEGTDSLGGNYYYMQISMGLGEVIPELVRTIKFLARRGNNGVPFYIGDIDPAALTFVEYTEQNLGVVPTRYLQNFELVPLLAAASCITKSRSWFADYLEGYDTPTSGVTITGTLVDLASPAFGYTFSRNSKFRLGVVFFDSEGRSSGVMDDNWVIETPRAIGRSILRTYYEYSITGTAPAWATHFAPVMTKDIIKKEFYEGWGIHNTGSFIYVSESGGVETYSVAYSGTTKYLRLSMTTMNGRGIYYTVKDDDKVLVTQTTSGITYGPLKVRKISDGYVYVDAVDIGGVAAQYDFQIFTPNTEAEGIYYEIGAHKRAVGIGGALDSTTFAILGDCIARNMNTPSLLGYEMSQMRFKPNDGDWNRTLGKIHVKTSIGQVRKSNFIRHSSVFIPGIAVNGLSEFSSGDEGSVPVEAVKIQKLQPTSKESTDGEVILAICNSDTYSIYVDEARMSTNDGQSFLISQTKVIGDVRKQRSGFGTLHPESVFEEEGNVFWWDQLARSFVRYATNGIFPLSEYKAVTYFEKQAELNDEDDLVFSGYDPFYKLVVVTFPNAETSRRKTIGFSLPKERWISFYGFRPTGYIIGSNKLYSFSDGVIYSHDNVNNFNTFYEAAEKIAAPDTDWDSLIGSWTFGTDYIQVPMDTGASSQVDAYQFLDVPLGESTNPLDVLITISGVWTGRIDIQFFLDRGDGGVVSDTWIKQYTGNVTNDPETVDPLLATGEATKLHVRMFFTNFPSGNPTVKIELPVGDIAFVDNVQDSKLGISFNDEPSTPKEWKVIQVQASPNFYSFSGGNQVVATDALRVDITNRHGQETDVLYNEFEVDENMIYGEIRGDANSTGGVLNGDPIYSNTIQTTLTLSPGEYKQVVMVKAGCEPSRGHNL